MPTSTRDTVTDGYSVTHVQPFQYERSCDDMLIAYSTLPGNVIFHYYWNALSHDASVLGYVSYRQKGGTWFIKALCLVFMEEVCVQHVYDLLKRVDELVKHWVAKPGNGKQTLEIISRGFNKDFYFNPSP
jgi:Caspase domain